MISPKPLSRRSLLAGMAISPACALSTGETASDEELLILAREFDSLAAKIDQGLPEWDVQLFDRVFSQIVATPAKTIEGLCVKARIVCWAQLGDFDFVDEPTGKDQMAFSIVRDLIRTYDPDLERPGAVKKLVAEIDGAQSS